MVVRNQWSNNNIRELSGPFRMIVQNFCMFMRNFLMFMRNFLMFMRNQLKHPPYTIVNFPSLIHFAQSCNFCMIIQICNIWFLSSSLSFLPFSSFDSTLTTSKLAANPDQTNYIASFIMHLDNHQYYLPSSNQFISFVTNLLKS